MDFNRVARDFFFLKTGWRGKFNLEFVKRLLRDRASEPLCE